MSQDNNNCEPNCPCGQYRKGERKPHAILPDPERKPPWDMILMGFRRKIIPMTKNQLIEEAVKYYKKCDEGVHSWIKLESNLPAGRQHSFRCYFCGEELEGFHCSGGSPSGKGRHYSCHLFETPDEYIRRIRKELELKNRE